MESVVVIMIATTLAMIYKLELFQVENRGDDGK